VLTLNNRAVSKHPSSFLNVSRPFWPKFSPQAEPKELWWYWVLVWRKVNVGVGVSILVVKSFIRQSVLYSLFFQVLLEIYGNLLQFTGQNYHNLQIGTYICTMQIMKLLKWGCLTLPFSIESFLSNISMRLLLVCPRK